MAPEDSDQQQFDEQVNKNGELAPEVLAGVGVFAAVVMSLIALLHTTTGTTTTTVIQRSAALATSMLPMIASAAINHTSAAINHTTVGCHTLNVAGRAAPSPHASAVTFPTAGTYVLGGRGRRARIRPAVPVHNDGRPHAHGAF